MPRQSFFYQVWADFGRQLETDIGEKERDDFHGATLQAEARQTAMMNKLQASTQTILLVVQLQKEMGETVTMSLQTAAKDTIRQIEHSTASQGTHDAIDQKY